MSAIVLNTHPAAFNKITCKYFGVKMQENNGKKKALLFDCRFLREKKIEFEIVG